MKKFFIALSMFFAVAFTTNSAQAQITSGDVLNAASGLINVQIGDVNVNAVDVIDVSNVLNNNDVQLLNNILNNLTIDNVLNNLLRDADIIKNNQIVVGILSSGEFLIMQQRQR